MSAGLGYLVEPQKCGDCRFWVVAGGKGAVPSCHRSAVVVHLPPLARVLLLGMNTGSIPVAVSEANWCGEWEARGGSEVRVPYGRKVRVDGSVSPT